MLEIQKSEYSFNRRDLREKTKNKDEMKANNFFFLFLQYKLQQLLKLPSVRHERNIKLNFYKIANILRHLKRKFH